MQDCLFIRMLSDGEGDCQAEWLWLGEEGVRAAQPAQSLPQALASLPRDREECRVIVLLPGESVLLTAVDLPARQARYLDQVLPYAVEEHIAEDVSGMHLVGARWGESDRVKLLALRRDALAGWLEKLKQAGVGPEVALPETLCLPVEKTQATLLMEHGRCLLRLGEAAACVLSPGEWPLLNELGKSASGGFTLLLPAGQEAASLEGVSHPVTPRPLAMTALEALARGYLAQEKSLLPLNLLQGAFRPARQRSDAAPWHKLLMVAAVWIGALVLLDLARLGYLSYRTYVAEAEMTALYKEWFPNEKRIVSPYAQLRNRLQSGAGGAGEALMERLSAVAEAMRAMSGESKSLMIQQLRYEEESGALTMTVNAPSIALLETFRLSLETGGWQVELSSATQMEGKMEGMLRMTGR